MLRLTVRLRLVVLAACAVVLAAAPATAVASPAAHGAKKKKKPAALTGTVSGTFSIRADDPLGFGNDNGPKWQQITVEIKKAVVTFPKGIMGAGVKAPVTFTYHAEASTEDRSYHLGCDSEHRETSGTWTGKVGVGVKETAWLQTDGKSKRFGGWTVSVDFPDDFPLTTKGSYNDWESILMDNCQTFPIDTPLGGWTPGFAQPDGVGRLADDNRSVPLQSIDTDKGQTGKASGTLRFNKAPR